MHKRTKALAIPYEVKAAVYKRDDRCCVWCGRPGSPNAHFIPRSKSGLGIEENVLTLCPLCHQLFDNGAAKDRRRMAAYFREYLKAHYEDWDESNLYYRKE